MCPAFRRWPVAITEPARCDAERHGKPLCRVCTRSALVLLDLRDGRERHAGHVRQCPHREVATSPGPPQTLADALMLCDEVIW